MEQLIDKEEIKKLIIFKYGTLDKYAIKLGITRQALYYRLENINKNFLRDLEEDGLIEKNNITNSLVVGTQYGGTNTHNSPGIVPVGKNEPDFYKEIIEADENGRPTRERMLLTEVRMLKEIIKSRDRVIELLEREIEYLKNK